MCLVLGEGKVSGQHVAWCAGAPGPEIRRVCRDKAPGQHMPGTWDSGGQAELRTGTPSAGLSKTGLKNPCAPGHKDCPLIRERGNGIRGREDHHGSVLPVSNNS